MNLFDLENLKPMPISLVSSRTPIIIGHRGAMAVAPENMMHAFQAALEAGADGIKFDVQRTIDGHLIIFHDEDVTPYLRWTRQNAGNDASRNQSARCRTLFW